MKLFSHAEAMLVAKSIEEKIRLTNALYYDWKINPHLENEPFPNQFVSDPNRPDKPVLVSPGKLYKRKLSTKEGHAALIHAIAHIEFNAIHLALDAIYRFRKMPVEYYTDWLQVAFEEAKHFVLLREHLITLGYEYGDFPAHNGLWEMAKDTDYDVLVRMALVPRLLEARGLDVTPDIQNKLKSIGDHRGVEILDIIFKDEQGHVQIGTHWYRFCCEERQLDPLDTFKKLIKKHANGVVRAPIHREARLNAGFWEEEIEMLEGLMASYT